MEPEKNKRVFSHRVLMLHHTFFVIAQQTQQPQGSPLASMLVPFICIGVIFYFLIIRPQSQRQKQHDTLVKSLETGDKVVTNGGIHGLISNVKETTVLLKIADNVKIEVDKTSITTVAKRSKAEPAAKA